MLYRARQVLLVACIMWLSWLAMMLVHESGHVLGALCSGGHVVRVVWHPAVLSRTDVRPNPHPLVEVWGGPLIGSLIPLVVAAIVSTLRPRIAYLFWVVGGFCLIANGAYIGIGAFRPNGDAKELIAHGMPRWTLAGFGTAALILGLSIWDRTSPKLGFGKSPKQINATHVYVACLIAVVVTVVGIAVGSRGI